MPALFRCPSTTLVTLALCAALATVAVPTSSHAAELPTGLPAADLAGALAASEPGAPEQTPRVGVRVDTSALGDGDEAMQTKLEERAAAVLAERGFLAASDPRDPVLVIVVEASGSVEEPGFVVGTLLERGDEVVPGSAGQLECSLCTRTELVERIEAELPPLLDLAREHQVPAETDGAGGSGGGEGPEPGDPRPPHHKPIGPLGYAGIGLAVVGLAGVGAGAGLVARGIEPLADRPAYQKNFRTPGFVVLGLGGAVLVAGAVALAVDLSQRKRARAEHDGGSARDARVRPHGLGVAF